MRIAIVKRDVLGPRPVLGMGLRMHCANRAVLEPSCRPVLGMGLRMYCANRVVLGPVLGMALKLHITYAL